VAVSGFAEPPLSHNDVQNVIPHIGIKKLSKKAQAMLKRNGKEIAK
jgi:hypothetical protein